MARKCFVFLLLGLFAAMAPAAEIIIVTESGYFLLTKDANNNPVIVKPAMIDLRGVSTPPPGPTDPPNPTLPLEVLKKTIQEVTAAVPQNPTDATQKARTKTALSELYRTVAGLPVTTVDQLKVATDTIFNAIGLSQASGWLQWKTKVDQAVASFVDVDNARKAWTVIADELAKPSLN